MTKYRVVDTRVYWITADSLTEAMDAYQEALADNDLSRFDEAASSECYVIDEWGHRYD